MQEVHRCDKVETCFTSINRAQVSLDLVPCNGFYSIYYAALSAAHECKKADRAKYVDGFWSGRSASAPAGVSWHGVRYSPAEGYTADKIQQPKSIKHFYDPKIIHTFTGVYGRASLVM